MSTRNSGIFRNLEGVILLTCVFLAIKSVYGLADFAHVDTATSLEMNLKFLMLGGLYLISKIGGDSSLFSLIYRLPVILAGLWYAWWPALDYWALQQQSTGLVDYVLWDTPVAKVFGLVVAFFVGLTINKLRDN